MTTPLNEERIDLTGRGGTSRLCEPGARSQTRRLVRNVMRRKLLIPVVSVVILGGAVVWLLMWHSGNRGLLESFKMKTAVISNHYLGNRHEMIAAKTEFFIPSACSLDASRFEVLIETAEGWKFHQAATTDGSRNTPLDLRAGARNRMTFLLPAEAVRWRLLLRGREASLRLRWFYRLSNTSGAWTRDGSSNLRPFWKWVLRKLPNAPGRPLQLESVPLPIRRNEPLTSPPNETRIALAEFKPRPFTLDAAPTATPAPAVAMLKDRAE